MNTSLRLLLLLCINCNAAAFQSKKDICGAEDVEDTNIEEQTYINSEPSGIIPDNVSILQKLKVKSTTECVKNCCAYEDCDAVSIVQNICILFNCNPKEACKPVKTSKLVQNVEYIVFTSSFYLSNDSSIVLQQKKFDEESQSCEINVWNNCPHNEICKRINDYKRTGICVCVAGFVKKESGCVQEKAKYGHKDNNNSETHNNWNEEKKTSETTLSYQNKAKNHVKDRNDLETHKNWKKEKKPPVTTISYQKLSTRKTTKLSRPLSKVTEVNKMTKKYITANAGPDIHIHMANPQVSTLHQIVSIHGSAASKFNKPLTAGISYEWIRDPSSLAVGSILNNSDHTSTLMLTNLLQGQYIFNLVVTNKNGIKASDSVTLFVTETLDDQFGNLVDILFDTDVFKFTEQESINFSRRMGHIIEKNIQYTNCQVYVKSVSSNIENRTLISFIAKAEDPNTKDNKMLSAWILEQKLKVKLTQHKFIFDYPVLKFQSRVCFNPCGGHGICDASHHCKCTLPWMNNIWHERNTGFPNCDMHIMIIVVVLLALLFMSVLLLFSLKTLVRKCKRRSRFGKEVLRYKLLDNTES